MGIPVKPISLIKIYKEIQENEYVKDQNFEILEEKAVDILDAKSLVGGTYDFHNLAIVFSEANLNDFACKILERGISIYPRSVDLLADYLAFGIDCLDSKRKSEKYFTVLNSIDESMWTWRGYYFSLDYLYAMREKTNNPTIIEQVEKDIDTLIMRYYEKFPHDEGPYVAEANKFHGKDVREELRILKRAIDTLDFCPQCTIKYASMVLEKVNDECDYLKLSEKLKPENLANTKEIDFGYALFLRGVCLFKLLNGDDYSNEAKVREIYLCFRIANDNIMQLSATHRKSMQKQVSVLERYSQFDSDIVF
ncbi:hypothetical protein FACS1894188_05410 [Clostridia bacterium]|nr:hypothetical protein FACS1894188_05410 [Clostridia bacterium]